MTEIRASAPGKLMLCGEYAVLVGAPAILLAVNREVVVTVRPSRAAAGRLWARPLMEDSLAFDSSRAEFWLDRDRADRMLGMTSRLLPRLFEYLAPGNRAVHLDIEIDSRALFDRAADGQSVKLGLGSSAAITVALLRALARFFAHPIIDQSHQQQLDVLLPLYRSALQAAASGADLAASLSGGVSAVRADAERLLVKRLQWLPALHWQAIWTLKPAQTTDFVARFERWRSAEADASRWLDPLIDYAEHALAAFEARDANGVMRALKAYSQALSRMDAAIQAVLGETGGCCIVTPDHQSVIDQAASHDVLYKTCGAGGGDLGIAVSQQVAPLSGLVDGLSPMRARPLELRIAAEAI